MNPLSSESIAARERLRRWCVDAALPRWAGQGVDRQHGGFIERIGLDGRPVEAPRRTRVVARQIYVFAVAARLGWHPDAEALVDHGLDFLHRRSLLEAGHCAASVRPDGTPVDARFDLYEQAFALFAWAEARRDRPDREPLRGRALALLQRLRDGWGHALHGFEESAPPSVPLRSNPHMHLLEAALAWEAVSSTGDDRAPWTALADELVGLALARLIEPSRGAVLELFDRDWRPLAGPDGRLLEPGHQFEWGWLLMRWARLRDRPDVAARAARLLEIGEAHGVDARRGVAVNALDLADGSATDPAAKIWPQTERIKAWHLAAALAADATEAARADARRVAAIEGLERYLDGVPAGLWHEQMNVAGGFDFQDCRASSLYHVVCAIATLHDDADEAAR